MKHSINTILFDLDDTLIVEWRSAEDSFIETIRQIDSQIEIDEFVKTIRQQAKELWHKLPTIDFCLKIGISSWEALWADFNDDDEQYFQLHELSAGYRFDTWYKTLIRFNIDSAEIAERLATEFKRIRDSKHILFPETTEVLTKLKKEYKLGLITNGAPSIQWRKINGGNLMQYFDYIAISGEHGYAKPDTKLFEIAVENLRSVRDSTILVGNNLNTDIKGGRDFGLKTIWINRTGIKINEIRPDYEITNLSEIFEIITKK
jgi:putative hydrolase of the HAD superfamily